MISGWALSQTSVEESHRVSWCNVVFLTIMLTLLLSLSLSFFFFFSLSLSLSHSLYTLLNANAHKESGGENVIPGLLMLVSLPWPLLSSQLYHFEYTYM